MIKKEDRFFSVQWYNQLKTCIFDSIGENLNYCYSHPELDIVNEHTTLDVENCIKENAHSHERIFFETLTNYGKTDIQIVYRLFDNYILVSNRQYMSQ